MASKFVKKKLEQLRESLPVLKHLSNEHTQDAALLYLMQKWKARGLLEFQLIRPVIARITRMGQNNAVCYLTYLRSLVLFVEEIQKRILSPNMCPNISKIAFR